MPRGQSKKRHIEIEFEDAPSKKSKQTTNKKSKKESKTERKDPQPPAKWKEIWDGIEAMRAEQQAPVDTMGCAQLAVRGDEKLFRFQTLIGLMLSSQTKDQVTAQAMDNLKKFGLTPEKMAQSEEKDIDTHISKVGFHRRKSKYIKETSQILLDQYKGDIPEDLEGLLQLPGVGEKMAFLTLQEAWKKNIGIGVDVHVHRISNRLKWVKTKTPEQTRKELEDWLPKEYWTPINKMLVGFGQTICTPVSPKCTNCKISHLCPSVNVKKNT